MYRKTTELESLFSKVAVLSLFISLHFNTINPLLASVSSFYPLKVLENNGVFREYKMGTLANVPMNNVKC